MRFLQRELKLLSAAATNFLPTMSVRKYSQSYAFSTYHRPWFSFNKCVTCILVWDISTHSFRCSHGVKKRKNKNRSNTIWSCRQLFISLYSFTASFNVCNMKLKLKKSFPPKVSECFWSRFWLRLVCNTPTASVTLSRPAHQALHMNALQDMMTPFSKRIDGSDWSVGGAFVARDPGKKKPPFTKL